MLFPPVFNSGIFTFVKDVQFLKAESPVTVFNSGISTDVKFVQLTNTFLPTDSKLGRDTVIRPE